MLRQESELALAEHNMVTASQFNQLSQVTDKEGTSHFQGGLALTSSDLNNYQDSGVMNPAAENKENEDGQMNVHSQGSQLSQQYLQAHIHAAPTLTDESENYLLSQTSNQAPMTMQTSKNTGTAGHNPRGS